MNKSKITGVKSYGDGVIVNNYDDGRIKVKLPTRKFEHLKSLVAHGPEGLHEFLIAAGFPKTGHLEYYIELHTGHVCYVYRPEPKPKKAKPKIPPSGKPVSTAEIKKIYKKAEKAKPKKKATK